MWFWYFTHKFDSFMMILSRFPDYRLPLSCNMNYYTGSLVINFCGNYCIDCLKPFDMNISLSPPHFCVQLRLNFNINYLQRHYSGDVNEHIIDIAFEEVILRTMYNFARIIVTESISHLVIQENQIAWILNTQLNTIASKILINRKLTSRDFVDKEIFHAV